MKSFTVAIFLCSVATTYTKEDFNICDNFSDAHEYMTKKVVKYANCFRDHFYFSPTRKVCSDSCLEPLIRASQLVQQECNRTGLNAEEYDVNYKDLAYIPWSDRRGAEAVCAKDQADQTCMFALQKAETLIANNLGSDDYSASKRAVICSPCVKSLYSMYSSNPSNYPLVYFHHISDPEGVFKKIKSICEFETSVCKRY